MGSSDQAGNEIDEFVTETLRNNLLGLPTDLAAINMARARECGDPALNDVRAQIEEATNDCRCTLQSWTEFGQQLKHPESLVNFVAAYGRHSDHHSVPPRWPRSARAARASWIPSRATCHRPTPPTSCSATATGTSATVAPRPGSRTSTCGSAAWPRPRASTAACSGRRSTTCSRSSSTDLQDGDRFYYLNRTAGMNLLSQLEGNSFAEMIQRNTDGTRALKADAFSTVDCRFDLAHLDGTPDGFATTGAAVQDDPTTSATSTCCCSAAGRDDRLPARPTASTRAASTAQAVYDGTSGNDRVSGGTDDDTFWGGAGNDTIEGNGGDDVALGGDGDDVVTDADGADTLRGGPGDDAIDGGPGNDLVLGGDGADFTNGGGNDNQTFGGPGDDFVIAGDGRTTCPGRRRRRLDRGRRRADTPGRRPRRAVLRRPGPGRPGNDVLVGQAGDNDYDAEGGDDVMSSSAGVDDLRRLRRLRLGDPPVRHRRRGRRHAGQPEPVRPNRRSVVNRDVWQETEAISGSAMDDVLRGDDTVPREVGGVGFTGCDVLDQTGVDRIAGLAALLPQPLTGDAGPVVAAVAKPGGCPLSGPVWGEGNILLGGNGSDMLEGRGANDIIDGDRYLACGSRAAPTRPTRPARPAART